MTININDPCGDESPGTPNQMVRFEGKDAVDNNLIQWFVDRPAVGMPDGTGPEFNRSFAAVSASDGTNLTFDRHTVTAFDPLSGLSDTTTVDVKTGLSPVNCTVAGHLPVGGVGENVMSGPVAGMTVAGPGNATFPTSGALADASDANGASGEACGDQDGGFMTEFVQGTKSCGTCGGGNPGCAT